jgi:hypothetical protein
VLVEACPGACGRRGLQNTTKVKCSIKRQCRCRGFVTSTCEPLRRVCHKSRCISTWPYSASFSKAFVESDAEVTSLIIAATHGEVSCFSVLRTVRCVGATVPKRLVSEVLDVFGARLLIGWGMTEIGTGTVTRSDDSPDWAAYSDGRPVRGMEVDLRSDTEITKDRPPSMTTAGRTPVTSLCRTGAAGSGWWAAPPTGSAARVPR